MKGILAIIFFFFVAGQVAGDNEILFRAHEFTGWFPPDAGIAVSHSRIISSVNGQISLFNKTGVIMDSRTLRQFYRKSDAFDPRALYDAENDRFIVVVVNGRSSDASHAEIAISANGNIGSLVGNDWTFISIKVPEDGLWLDYPMMGLDSYNVYITGNMFTDVQNFGNGGRLYIIKKSLLYSQVSGTFLTNSSYAYYNFRDLFNTAFKGSHYSIQPTWNWDSNPKSQFLTARANTDLYLIEINNIESVDGDYRFRYYRIPVPLMSGIIYNAPQNGTDKYKVETNDVRLCEAMSINGQLVISHTTRNMTNGVCIVRVYQLDISNPSGPQLISVDEISDDIEPVPWHYFPAAGINERGTIGAIMVRSSAEEYLSITTIHKKKGMASFSTPRRIAKGETFYGRSRYGDYSSVALDPSDKLRFWYLGELPETGARWNAWIYSDCVDCETEPEVDCGPHGTWKADKGICECILGWNGTKCETCANGYWGAECKPCVECLNDGVCLDGLEGNGTCICLSDFFGERCQHTCKPNGSYHKGKCWCNAGYTGTYCNDCRFGRRNDTSCIICPDDCNERGLCNEMTSVCHCFERFDGRSCSKCADGYTGWPECRKDVVLNCNNGQQVGDRCICFDGWDGPDCSVFVGKCLNGVIKNGTCHCYIGWAGPECDTCATEYWGPNCENKCPWCSLHGTCNAQGQCDCHYGWQDARCQTCSWWYRTISIGKECQCGYCGPYGRCNVSTGECDCLEGWMGPKCSRCSDSASVLPCGQHGKCVNNECVCEDGWYGWTCEATNEKNYFNKEKEDLAI